MMKIHGRFILVWSERDELTSIATQAILPNSPQIGILADESLRK